MNWFSKVLCFQKCFVNGYNEGLAAQNISCVSSWGKMSVCEQRGKRTDSKSRRLKAKPVISQICQHFPVSLVFVSFGPMNHLYGTERKWWNWLQSKYSLKSNDWVTHLFRDTSVIVLDLNQANPGFECECPELVLWLYGGVSWGGKIYIVLTVTFWIKFALWKSWRNFGNSWPALIKRYVFRASEVSQTSCYLSLHSNSLTAIQHSWFHFHTSLIHKENKCKGRMHLFLWRHSLNLVTLLLNYLFCKFMIMAISVWDYITPPQTVIAICRVTKLGRKYSSLCMSL